MRTYHFLLSLLGMALWAQQRKEVLHPHFAPVMKAALPDSIAKLRLQEKERLLRQAEESTSDSLPVESAPSAAPAILPARSTAPKSPQP